MTTVTIPDFDFSGFYYPQLLEALMRYKRLNVPELTEESPYEPFNQLTRMIALVGAYWPSSSPRSRPCS